MTVGKKNLDQVKATSEVILEGNADAGRYRPFEFLNNLALRMAAGAADIIISRAGSTIYEIALWKTPSIIVPITESNGDHQRKNAFSYARSGAAIVIEEKNLSPHILTTEIKRVLDDPELQEKMKKGAEKFAHPNAAHLIAKALIDIALEHES